MSEESLFPFRPPVMPLTTMPLTTQEDVEVEPVQPDPTAPFKQTGISLHQCKCCAIYEINGLAKCRKMESEDYWGRLRTCSYDFSPVLKQMWMTYDYNENPNGISYFYTAEGGNRKMEGSSIACIKPFAMFTSNVRESNKHLDYGEFFAKFIEENELGSLICTKREWSWTGNTVRAWIWTVNWRKLGDMVKGLNEKPAQDIQS